MIVTKIVKLQTPLPPFHCFHNNDFTLQHIANLLFHYIELLFAKSFVCKLANTKEAFNNPTNTFKHFIKQILIIMIVIIIFLLKQKIRSIKE